MWIVRIALSRPYTFIVLALLLMILGPLALIRTPTDIFPNIDIPVVSVVWSYTGLPPEEMSQRITTNFERAVSTTVNDIEHLESQSMTGVSVTKLFFHPGVNIDLALAQVTAVAQTMLRTMPPGTTPPLVLSYNASTVPVIQVALSSSKMSSRTSTITATTSSAANWQPSKARRYRIPMAATAPDRGRSRPAGYAGTRRLTHRCEHCHRRAEPHPAIRHAEDRRLRIPGETQRQPECCGRTEQPAGEIRQRRHRLCARCGSCA